MTEINNWYCSQHGYPIPCYKCCDRGDEPIEFNPDYLKFKDGVAATERVWQEKIDRLFEEIEGFGMDIVIASHDEETINWEYLDDSKRWQALKAEYGGKAQKDAIIVNQNEAIRIEERKRIGTWMGKQPRPEIILSWCELSDALLEGKLPET